MTRPARRLPRPVRAAAFRLLTRAPAAPAVHADEAVPPALAEQVWQDAEQLERAQAEIARRGVGVLLYLRQEGRGIGLANKIRAYALQAKGADTIEANELLHLPVDARTYDVAAAMLRNLGVESVELLTNNPLKLDALRALGIQVERRVPVLVPANPFSASYLEVKRRRMQHDLPSSPSAPPPLARVASNEG